MKENQKETKADRSMSAPTQAEKYFIVILLTVMATVILTK